MKLICICNKIAYILCAVPVVGLFSVYDAILNRMTFIEAVKYNHRLYKKLGE